LGASLRVVVEALVVDALEEAGVEVNVAFLGAVLGTGFATGVDGVNGFVGVLAGLFH